MINKIIISVDAGGTKTKYLIFNKNGDVLYEYTDGCGSPCVDINAPDLIFNKLKEINNYIKNDIILKEYELSGIIIGMSGYALLNNKEYTDKLSKEFNCFVLLESDAYLALYSVLNDKYDNGVVVISGTGAIVIAKHDDLIFSTNGWGELLTERGSGYAIVRDYIVKMVRNYEETGKISNLDNMFMKYMNYNKMEDYKLLIYRHNKTEVANYCKFFLDKEKENNKEAKDWLYYNGRLLGIDTINALKRVNINKEDVFKLGVCGSVIENSASLRNGVFDTVFKEKYLARIDDLKYDPVYGGYFISKRKGLL